MSKIGETLKQGREHRGLTIKQAAEAAEIFATYLGRVEEGLIIRPSAGVLYKLAGVYGMSYMELMREAGAIIKKSEEQLKAEQERDEFALSFLVFALTDPRAQALIQARSPVTAILDLYKDRPYLGPDTTKQ
jgi:transcriptional regulator with XRE-family HTH domain